MKHKTIELTTVSLQTPICFDEQNRPTCSLWLPTGNYCKFLQSVRFGTESKCLFQEGKERLYTYEPDGRLKPWDGCPVHKKQDEQPE